MELHGKLYIYFFFFSHEKLLITFFSPHISCLLGNNMLRLYPVVLLLLNVKLLINPLHIQNMFSFNRNYLGFAEQNVQLKFRLHFLSSPLSLVSLGISIPLSACSYDKTELGQLSRYTMYSVGGCSCRVSGALNHEWWVSVHLAIPLSQPSASPV